MRPAKRIPSKVLAEADGEGVSADWPDVRARQREMKRNAVLQTAARMFNERGFHATSLDDVAARLNVSKPTLYYYIESKEEILLQCVRQGLAIMLEGIETSRRAGGRAIDQLVACMQVYGRVVTEDFGMCLIRVGDEGLTPEGRVELRRQKALIDQAFRGLVKAGIEEGSLRPCDPRMTAFTIAGALSWIGRWYRPDGELSAEEVVRHCVDTLLAGIVQRPDSSDLLAPSNPTLDGTS